MALATSALLRSRVSALGSAVGPRRRRPSSSGASLVGGLAVELASILDGSDGEGARLKIATSPFGTFFAAVLDRYADALVHFGAGFYAWAASGASLLFDLHGAGSRPPLWSSP